MTLSEMLDAAQKPLLDLIESLQDQLTQVRAENEESTKRWMEQVDRYRAALEAAEKREKALRDAAQELVDAERASQKAYSDAGDAYVENHPAQWDNLRRILERGEQK